MVEAVVDFVRKKNPKLVCMVKILIFQLDMTADFHRSMKRIEGKPLEEKGFFTKIKGIFLVDNFAHPACFIGVFGLRFFFGPAIRHSCITANSLSRQRDFVFRTWSGAAQH